MRKRKLPALVGVQRLRWLAAGDLLPDRTPDWALDHLWPGDLMQRLICWRWGHVPAHPIHDRTCIWCGRHSCWWAIDADIPPEDEATP